MGRAVARYHAASASERGPVEGRAMSRKLTINWCGRVWEAFQYDTETLGNFLRTKPALTDKDWADLADIQDGKIKRKKGRRPDINPHTEWIHKLYLALKAR